MDQAELDFATLTAYQLIEALDAAYPHQCILPGQPEWQAHRDAGRRQLIDELLAAKREEQTARAD